MGWPKAIVVCFILAVLSVLVLCGCAISPETNRKLILYGGAVGRGVVVTQPCNLSCLNFGTTTMCQWRCP